MEHVQDGPGADYVEQIKRLQSDALLLMTFVAGRSDRTVAPDLPAGDGQGGTDAARERFRRDFLRDLSAVLALPAAELAAKPAECGFLFGAVDYLACLAKPATIHTIRLTQAYTAPHERSSREDAGAWEGVRRSARALKWRIFAIGAGCVVALFLAIMLMAHVVAGQAVIQELQARNRDWSDTIERITIAHRAARPDAQGSVVPVREAEPREKGEGPCEFDADGRVMVLNPEVAKLCHRFADLRLKLDLTYTMLGVWNGATDTFYHVFPIPNWLRTPPEFKPEQEPKTALKITQNQRRTTELRARAMLTGLSVYGIPVLLGLLGAMAYVFRSLNAKLENSCLETQDWSKSTLRIMLGTILGGLVGLVFDAGGLEFSGLKLSLWFIAFLAGYSVHLVFEAFDVIVNGGVRMLRRQVSTEPPRTPLPTPLPGGPAG